MTIRLLAKHGKYDANTIVTFSAATEAGLVAAKLATPDTTGGVAYIEPEIPSQLYPASVEVDPTGNVKGIGFGASGIAVEVRPAHHKDNFYKKRPNVLDNMDACLSGVTGGTFGPQHGWVSTHNPVTLAVDFSDPRPNAPCFCSLSMAPAAGSSFFGVKRDLGGADGTAGIRPADGVLMIPFKIEAVPITAEGPPATENVVSMQIILSTTDNFNTATAPATATAFSINTANTMRLGWNDVLVSALDDGTLNNLTDQGGAAQPGWKYEGTAPGDANTLYRYMRIVVTNGQPTTLTPNPVYKIGGVFQGGMAKPNIIIHCDDAHKDTVDLLRIYNARKIPVTIGAITYNVDTGKGQTMGVDLLAKLYSDGNDIVSHTVTHPSGGLAALTPEQLKTEVEASLAWLRKNKLARTADVIVYPENNFRDRDLAAVKAAGYSLGRGRRPGWIPTIFGIDNPLALGSRDFGKRTLAQMKKMVDSAIAYGTTQILYMHRIAAVDLTSVTFANGTGTAVHPAGAAVPAGTVFHLRGASSDVFNITAYVEAGSTPTGFTFKYLNPNVPNATVTKGASANIELRFYSPTWPVSGGTPPSDGLYWYMSDHIAFANHLAAQREAGAIDTISMATLAERCQLG